MLLDYISHHALHIIFQRLLYNAELDIEHLEESLRQQAAQLQSTQTQLQAATRSKDDLQHNVTSLQGDVQSLK